MTVAIYVTNQTDATTLIPWGVRFAHADHTDLLIVSPKRSKGKQVWNELSDDSADDNSLNRCIFETVDLLDQTKIVLKKDIASGDQDSDHDRVVIEMRQLVAPNPEIAFTSEVAGLDVTLLLVSAHHLEQSNSEERWCRELFLTAPCDTVLLAGSPPEKEQMEILLATDGGEDTEVALKRTRQLLQSYSGKATVLYVRPDDDIVAREIAGRKLGKLVQKLPDVEIEKRVELSDSLIEGVNRLGLEKYDLIFIGSRHPRKIVRIIKDYDANTDENAKLSLAIIREAVPLTNLLWGKIQKWVRDRVPQLDRDGRVNLVDQLQSNSKFNFDFVALISLSTLIAALGLVLNSGAVVIGAMLVAPLMTPLVGTGFSLVQGNTKLVRNALHSVVFGFAVAFVIAVIVGLTIGLAGLTGLVNGVHVTSEMEGRGHPTIIDLMVALASGIAGAYAMGRPNLVSAIPGVAIAAALVPPIATSGMAISIFRFDLAMGSLLLFLTNIVAIVLGTTIVFWAVGINSESVKSSNGNRQQPIWPRLWFFTFVIVSFVLAAIMTIRNAAEQNQALDSQTSGQTEQRETQ